MSLSLSINSPNNTLVRTQTTLRSVCAAQLGRYSVLANSSIKCKATANANKKPASSIEPLLAFLACANRSHTILTVKTLRHSHNKQTGSSSFTSPSNQPTQTPAHGQPSIKAQQNRKHTASPYKRCQIPIQNKQNPHKHLNRALFNPGFRQ